MKAQLMARLQAQAKAKSLAATRAQAKVGVRDQNFIDALKKQISTMEAKKNPSVSAAAAKKKAINNIQKSLTNKILKRLDDTQPLVNVFSKMQSLSKMMPAVQDFERRLGILHDVEPIIENAVKTLQKAIDLNGSPLQPAMPKAAQKPKVEDDYSLDSLTAAAAAPAAPAGGLDLASL